MLVKLDEVVMEPNTLVIGAQIAEAVLTGPGTVALAPTLMGDIVALQIDGSNTRPWHVGKHSFLACTSDVTKDTTTQGLGKTMFSGEGLFIYRMQGNGLAWLTSYGAIDTIEVS